MDFHGGRWPAQNVFLLLLGISPVTYQVPCASTPHAVSLESRVVGVMQCSGRAQWRQRSAVSDGMTGPEEGAGKIGRH